MIKNSYILLAVVLLIFTSCKKEEIIYDREDSLDLDTGFVKYNVIYQNHSATQLNVQVDMLVLNGLNSETGYGLYQFDLPNQENYDINVSNSLTAATAPVGSYSTVVMVNLNNSDYYKQSHTGAYLRRFFELADSLPNRNVAFSTFNAAENSDPRFHRENAASIFGNSWEYNVETYYNLTTKAGFSSGNANGLFLKHHLLAAIDTMVLEGATGDRSITLISTSDDYYFSNNLDKQEIIAAANANNVRINLIGMNFNYEMHQIAGQTGGFLIEMEQPYAGSATPSEPSFEPIQVGVQNLDKILKRNVNIHRCNVVATQQGADVFTSGQVVDFNLSYNGKNIPIKIELP